MEKKGLKLDQNGDYAGEKKERNEKSEVAPKVDRWWLEFQDSKEEKWAKLTRREQQKKLEEKKVEEKKGTKGGSLNSSVLPASVVLTEC
jgi:hypothetical protein